MRSGARDGQVRDGLLVAVARPAFPFMVGGDGTIAHTLLSGLAERGIACRFVGRCDETVTSHLDRLTALGVAWSEDERTLAYEVPYPVVLAKGDRFAEVLDRILAERRPRWVLAQLNRASEAIALGRRHGCRRALYLLDVDHEEGLAALDADPDLVLSVSGFVRSEIERRFARRSRVLYPLIDFSAYRTEETGEAVTLINPVPVKGAETALAVAAALPERPFLFVEGWRTIPAIAEHIRRLPNADFLPKQVDMRPVYRRTRLLIVPSVWQEGFGRVVLEAQASGIPVVASRIGGLPEAVGEGGLLIDDLRDPGAWIAAVERLLVDRAEHRRLATAARRNCARFALEHELDRVVRILGL